MNATLEEVKVAEGTTSDCIRRLNAQYAHGAGIRFRWYAESPNQTSILAEIGAELIKRFVLAVRKRACSTLEIEVTFIERDQKLLVCSDYVASPFAAEASDKDFDFPNTLQVLHATMGLKKDRWNEQAWLMIPVFPID